MTDEVSVIGFEQLFDMLSPVAVELLDSTGLLDEDELPRNAGELLRVIISAADTDVPGYYTDEEIDSAIARLNQVAQRIDTWGLADVLPIIAQQGPDIILQRRERHLALVQYLKDLSDPEGDGMQVIDIRDRHYTLEEIKEGPGIRFKEVRSDDGGVEIIKYPLDIFARGMYASLDGCRNVADFSYQFVLELVVNGLSIMIYRLLEGNRMMFVEQVEASDDFVREFLLDGFDAFPLSKTLIPGVVVRGEDITMVYSENSVTTTAGIDDPIGEQCFWGFDEDLNCR